MTIPAPLRLHRKSNSFTLSTSSLPLTSPKEFRNSIVNSLKKIRSNSIIGLNSQYYNYNYSSQSSLNSYKLEPIEDFMMEYRKGFELRSEDDESEFDNIVNYGFGIHANEMQYTLKLSLTPTQIRNSNYSM
ncbi:hypothetical protein CONCODRAFT_80368 [Conidiobolus coronatus NRRL 28638]|uniref:Uncharacterized protein n=1 Tax=Conidiobolus coronatus (strain ATCC 28846 / CBS 209.66 / NRRL 28638) TaxID=796925 RepID=A0A137NVU2_CONC2|nr:hypothetical protein CONCODRAFT_80368 [Conidiobolus coronatus NRRL 28638]|eukprot:KXN66877.1 hypothetical protein CONCODRAFT_80368 [Conidiobolus coronatus NRRL 28638]